MLTHVHKVIHLVVGTFEARVKKIEVKRSWSRWSQSDRTLVSDEPTRLVSCNSEDAGVGQTTRRWVALRPDASRVHPVSADVR